MNIGETPDSPEYEFEEVPTSDPAVPATPVAPAVPEPAEEPVSV